MADKFVPMYDLDSLNETQRQDYVAAVCKHMGVPPELNLVMLTYLDENDGPRRLVAYAKRGATEIIRNTRGINVTDLTSKEIGGSIVFTATGKDSTGRQEMSTGSKYIYGLVGKELDDNIMTAQTRATRRMTLQFVGAGVLDESEVNPKLPVSLTNTTPVAPTPQPAVQPNNTPGKDITENQEQFEERMKQLRANAIAQLNQSTKSTVEPATPKQEQGAVGTGHPEDPAPAVEKKTRKPRGPNKPKINLGLSEPVPTASVSQAVVKPETLPASSPVPEPAVVAAPPAASTPPPAPGKPRLTPEQVKPFRQRLFKIVNNELEPNGFAPKEGMGNQDKMRSFATMMFPDVTNMNELTVQQWEQYLTAIENKIKLEGPAAAVKYIEDAIGL